MRIARLTDHCNELYVDCSLTTAAGQNQLVPWKAREHKAFDCGALVQCIVHAC